MAHAKSALKRIRQNHKRHLRNQAVKTRLRGLIKNLRTSFTESDPEKIKAAVNDVSRALDKAATKGVVHKRTAARKKSRLAKATHQRLDTIVIPPR